MRTKTRGVFLKYQKDWMREPASIAVAEKARRIGFTWSDAAESTFVAGRQNSPANVFYICYNEELTREYIETVADWARFFHAAASKVQQVVYHDEDRDIKAFRVDFAAGKKVLGLTSRPRNIRGRQGRVVIDEAGFHDDLRGLIKAAASMLIWGGQVRIISTHNGEHNEFNRVIKDIKVGRLDYALHTVTFDDALRQGLYRQVCKRQKRAFKPSEMMKWRRTIYRQHGRDANEELRVIPDKGAGLLFKRHWLKIIDLEDVPAGGEYVRYWDRAASEPSGANPDPDYTAGPLVKRVNGTFYLMDLQHERFTPGGVKDLIKTTAEQDGQAVKIGLEQEPGASGVAEIDDYVKWLVGFTVRTFPARVNKLVRAGPFSAQAQHGNFFMVRAPWNDTAIEELVRFDGSGKGHDDIVDGIAGAVNMIAGIDDGMFDFISAGRRGSAVDTNETEAGWGTVETDGEADGWQ